MVVAAFKQLQCQQMNINIYRPSNQTLLRRLYSAAAAKAEEAQPQLSPDLINIMEQKLSAIENRHAHLQAIVNQVI